MQDSLGPVATEEPLDESVDGTADGSAEAVADGVPVPDPEAAMLIPPPATAEESGVRDTASTILMFAGILLLGMTIWRMLRKTWMSRRRGGRVTKFEEPGMDARPRARMAAIERKAAKRDEMDGVVADAEEVVRRLVGHLEAKAVRLEILLDRAEACAERLEAAAVQMESRAEATSGPGPGASPGHGTRPAAGVSPEAASARVDQHDQLGRPGFAGAAADRGPSLRETRPENGRGGGAETVEQEIVRLHEGGETPMEIATRLGRPIGQVELVLALRRRA